MHILVLRWPWGFVKTMQWWFSSLKTNIACGLANHTTGILHMLHTQFSLASFQGTLGIKQNSPQRFCVTPLTWQLSQSAWRSETRTRAWLIYMHGFIRYYLRGVIPFSFNEDNSVEVYSLMWENIGSTEEQWENIEQQRWNKISHSMRILHFLVMTYHTVNIGVLIRMFQNSTLLQGHRFPWQPWLVSKESQCSFCPEIDFQHGNLLYTSYCGSIWSIESLPRLPWKPLQHPGCYSGTCEWAP